MFKGKDSEQIKNLGIAEKQIEWQLNIFRNGVPFVNLNRAATIGDGIIRLEVEDEKKLCDLYNQAEGFSKIKFVPSSGAASRMFKTLFEFLETEVANLIPDSEIEQFIKNLGNFAFYEDLKTALESKGAVLQDLLDKSDYQSIISTLLKQEGLNYGNKPKGLLKFHNYEQSARTAFEEHLIEAALYALSEERIAKLHFTVSPEHLEGFERLLEEVKTKYEQLYDVKFQVSFSIQKISTDTIAVDSENQPFRNIDGSILFRPGGHGALIYNLDELDSDLIFIKNIDNVVPEKFVNTTVQSKKVLAGKLIELQSEIFALLRELDKNEIKEERIREMYAYINTELCYEPLNDPDFSDLVKSTEVIKTILNRPIRVCGVVKNLGEPGGGPYWAPNSKGDICLQIIESSQVNMDDSEQKKVFSHATHFNPVDLVCSPKDYKGNKFDLKKHVDPATCFISRKSKDGKDLKALELPGLWNGAMADWLTVFIEVPIDTFNPVKTVNDLLRPMHQ